MLRRLTALATPGARHALSVAARPRLIPIGAALVGSTVAAVSASCIAEPTEKSNPLLAQPSLFPRYADIRAEHVQPALDERLDAAEAALVRLEAAITAKLEAGGTPTYSELNDEAERIEELVGGPWSAVNHLKSVKDEEALRKAVELTQPKVVRFSTRMSQSAPLYRGWSALRADATAWATLSETQRRVAEIAIRDAKLAGIGLEGAAKARFNEIAEELAQLSTSFGNNVLDATKAFALTLTDKAAVAGLPESALAQMAATARRKGQPEATAADGPWVVTLDGACLMAVLRFADDAQLREKVYRAHVTKASEFDDKDNAPTINRILVLRQERALLLGFSSHAEVSLAKKMASLDGANALLEDLRAKSYDKAAAEHQELEAFAGRPLANWDVGYYAEKLKVARYAFDEEQTRQYLPLDAVLAGLFGVCRRLFSVDIAQVEPASVGAQLWDEQVRLFEVRRDGAPIGYFYLDAFVRPGEKKGGAWMNGVVGRSRALAPPGAQVRLPVAVLCCNQAPPVTDPASGEVTPSLMTFGECTTLFHETGHGLQHMLTQVDEGPVAGISGVEWDAVEQPSQFMEYWVLEAQTLGGMARHWKTGEPIPTPLLEKVRAAKTYRAASAMVRQLVFACTDLAIHSAPFEPAPGAAALKYREVALRTSPTPPLPEDRFLNGFAHIFAGGYAAGYFSYKWAEVLSADGFAAFEEAGLADEERVAQLGRLYAHTVMGMGGSRPAAQVFELFRGRGPTATALLRHDGLL